MRVDKTKARTLEEEYAYLSESLNDIGNYFAWDVHPNVIRATDLREKKIRKKMALILEKLKAGMYD